MVNRKLIPVIALALLFALPLSSVVPRASEPGIVVLVDLAHGESAAGLDMAIKVLPEAEFYILVSSQDQANSLSPIVKELAYKILVGTFDSITSDLKNVNVIIIPQPTMVFSPAEVQAIVNWFNSTATMQKAIWLAGDSDYPAQGGSQEIAMHQIDMIAEAIGTHLREDFVSVDDYASNCGATYRVAGLIQPDPGAEVVAFAAQKVLFHGPGIVAYVDDQGNWQKLNTSTFPNIYRIAWTSDKGKISENQPQKPGAPGELGKTASAGDSGKYVLLAAERMTLNISGSNATRFVVVSGESPIGSYQPGISASYIGVNLDGPRFFRNMILWISGYMGELKFVQQYLNDKQSLTSQLSLAQSNLQAAQQTISTLQQQLQQAQSSLSAANNQISQLSTQISALQSSLSKVNSTANSALETASGAASPGLAYGGIALGLIALIVAIVAMVMKPKK
jgi:hypothetical protein